MKWITARVSSQDEEVFSALNDTNHIFNFHDRILEIYGIDPIEGEEQSSGYGLEHTITGWNDVRMQKDKEGRFLDIIIHFNPSGKEWCWQPFVDFMMHNQAFSDKNILRYDVKKITKYKFGYIDGRHHHLAILKQRNDAPENQMIGYRLWSVTYAI